MSQPAAQTTSPRTAIAPPARPWVLLGVLLAAALGLGAPAGPALAGPQVPYPAGYREWVHVKSMVIEPGHPLADPFQGIHHVYANGKALEGLRSGRYADGAVLVFDLLDYTEQGHALVEGRRKLVGVMWRDSRRYGATGGWGFEAFAGDSRERRLTRDGGRACFACHRSQEARGYVFSRWRP